MHGSRLREVKRFLDSIKAIEHASRDCRVIIEHEDDPDIDQIRERQVGCSNNSCLRVVIVVLREVADSVQQLRRLGLVKHANATPDLD